MGGYALTLYHFCHEIRLFRASFDRKFAKNIGGQRDYFNIIIKLKILKFRLFQSNWNGHFCGDLLWIDVRSGHLHSKLQETARSVNLLCALAFYGDLRDFNTLVACLSDCEEGKAHRQPANRPSILHHWSSLVNCNALLVG